MGTPSKMQKMYLGNRPPCRSSRGLALEGWDFLAKSSDSETLKRATRSNNPITPPMRYASLQGTYSLKSDAARIPSMPSVATIVVPRPRFSFGRDSATNVMAAPSSPARPTPPRKRQIA
jgi:hypothetical protein